MSTNVLNDSPLGQEVSYPTYYDNSVLFAIERKPNRAELHIPTDWHGADVWYAYEISWLNSKGKPIVAVGRFSTPWDSPYLIESKSLKLYLNSFNESQFDDINSVQQTIARDLSAVAQATVDVCLHELTPYSGPTIGQLEGEVIDGLDIAIDCYQPNAHLLQCVENSSETTESVVSHLLKSNCPVTGQPDWGTVQIKYTGKAIDPAALLRYIVSFRQHTEFHEHCVERMYNDIMKHCQPSALFLMALYTRRGGLDINPWRSSHAIEVEDLRTVRQ